MTLALAGDEYWQGGIVIFGYLLVLIYGVICLLVPICIYNIMNSNARSLEALQRIEQLLKPAPVTNEESKPVEALPEVTSKLKYAYKVRVVDADQTFLNYTISASSQEEAEKLVEEEHKGKTCYVTPVLQSGRQPFSNPDKVDAKPKDAKPEEPGWFKL
jgi:hypothetical protein